MHRSKLIDLYDQDQRIAVTYPDSRREVAADIVRHVGLGEAGTGTVLYTKLTAANADAAIRDQIAYFDSTGQGFEWKVFDYDAPPDLKARLAQHGFEVEVEEEAVMVLVIAEAPEFLGQPVAHDIRRLNDPAQLVDVRAVEEKVWASDYTWLITYLHNTLSEHPDLISIYVAWADDRPVSTAWAYFPPHSRFVSLWGGSTLPDYRQRGFYSALLATRLQEAADRGREYLTVDASPMSRPILEKFGFEMIALSWPCTWDYQP